MTPTAEVVTKYLPTIFPELQDEPFFAYTIPEEYQQFNYLPFFKVTTVGETNGDFGSDKYNSRTYRIQIMVFIDIEVTDIEYLNDSLDRGLEKNDFVQVYGEDNPHTENKKIHVLIRQYTHTRRK